MDAEATTGSGTVDTSGATIIDLVDESGNEIASAAAGGSTVTVMYQ